MCFSKCCSWMGRSAMEVKLQNQQDYISFSLDSAPISPPVKTFSANALICWRKGCYSLWRLGTTIEYRSLGHLFGVGLSTVCVAVHEVCTTIVDVLSQGDWRKCSKGSRRLFAYMGIFTMIWHDQWIPYSYPDPKGRPIKPPSHGPLIRIRSGLNLDRI